MMIVFGARLFGKVDHVPGHFYVATRFAHVSFVPLVPTSSWVVLEAPQGGTLPTSWHGTRLQRIAWRSVAMAWLRAALLGAALVAAFFGLGSLGDPQRAVTGIALAVLAVAAFAASYRVGRADAERARALARKLGLPEEMEAQIGTAAQGLVH